jgi:subtilisin-like proprotein convertase family protein
MRPRGVPARSYLFVSAVVLSSILALAGARSAQASTFSNPAPITIPDQGPATPYPSTITVSGLTGMVSDVNVTLTGFSHTFPSDVGVLLVGPTGANVVLMDGPDSGNDVSNLTFTFDDAAASSLSCGDVTLVSGTYQPNTCFPNDVFPAPAPGGPYGGLLSVFNGTDPNGTWNLYVNDFATGDSGSISGGWSLDITTQPVAVTVASFRAARVGKGVVVRWRTGTEVNELGFNVYRQRGGRRVRVNRRLLPAIGAVAGASYSFVDRRAPRHRVVRYWLQDVDLSGARTWHGPVRVAAS